MSNGMPAPGFDLRHAMQVAIPLAVAWAQEQESIILDTGVQLSPELIEIARKVGVQRPDLVRVRLVPQLPQPNNPILLVLAKTVQLITPNTAGITFQHGIYIRQDCANELRLHAHELAHVGQYERLGGIQPFMHKYCQQLATAGYHNAPMEVEARKAEDTCG